MSSRSLAAARQQATLGMGQQAADLQKHWWGVWGLNPRPTDYESAALTG